MASENVGGPSIGEDRYARPAPSPARTRAQPSGLGGALTYPRVQKKCPRTQAVGARKPMPSRNPPLFTGGLHLEFALYHHRAGPPRRRIAGGGLGDPAALVRRHRGALGAIFLFSLLFSGEQRSASPPALTLRPARPARVAPPVASQHHARPRAGRPLAPPLTPCSPSADWLILCKLRRRGPPAAPPPPPRRPPRAAAMAAPRPHPLSTPLPPLSPPLSSIFTFSNPLPPPPYRS